MLAEVEGDATWDFLLPLVLEAVGPLLDVDDLRAARLACRHWREHLTARLTACCEGGLPLVTLHPDLQQFQRTLEAVKRCLPHMHSCKVYLSSRLSEEVSEEEIGMLAQLAELKFLQLSSETIPDKPLLGACCTSSLPPSVSRLTALTRLDLHLSSTPPPQSLAPLAALTALRQLDICSFNGARAAVLNEDHLAVLSTLQQLRALSLPLQYTKHIDDVVVPLQQLALLQDLKIRGTYFPPPFLPLLLGPHLTHLACMLALEGSQALLMAQVLPGLGLLPPERAQLPVGAPGNPWLSLTLPYVGDDAALEVLEALGPNLLHLHVDLRAPTRTDMGRVQALLHAVPTLVLVGLRGAPGARPPGDAGSAIERLLPSMASIEVMELHRPGPRPPRQQHQHIHEQHQQQQRHKHQRQRQEEGGSSGALASLTRLSLGGALFESRAAGEHVRRFGSLRELRLHDLYSRCTLPLTALPCSLTSLFLSGCHLLFPSCCRHQGTSPDGSSAGRPQAPPSNAVGSCSLLAAAPSQLVSGTDHLGVGAWVGLPSLESIQVTKCRMEGGSLAALLRGMPGLRQLAFDVQAVVSGGERQSQLQGCCPRLTALELMHDGGGLEGGEEAAGQLQEMLAWVQGLRSLRKLSLPLRRPSAWGVGLQGGLLEAMPQVSLLHFLDGARFIDDAAMGAALQQLPLADATKFPRWNKPPAH